MFLRSGRSKIGQNFELDGLTVLVGPNNSGKSQTLRDIHSLLTIPGAKPVILESIDDGPLSIDDLLRNVSVTQSKTTPTNKHYLGLDSRLGSTVELEFPEATVETQFHGQQFSWLREQFGKFGVSFLDAGSRLVVAQSGPSHDVHNGFPSTLLQHLFEQDNIKAELNDAFSQTFGIQVRLDYSSLQTLSLRVANDFGEVPADPREAGKVMPKFGKLDDQGDGFRSFVGVVLSILLTRSRIVLLDEPEAFLHPEQARRLGRWIAREAATGSQSTIVATHNAHFLQGLLSAGSDIRIIRLNRTGDESRLTEMSREATSQFNQSPLLSSQRVLESIFHRVTVVCEADSDRMVYQTVAAHEFGQTDILFVNAQNKQTCGSIAKLLIASDIPVQVIVDIDILNDKKEFDRLMQSCGVEEQEREQLEILRASVDEHVRGAPENELLDRAAGNIRELLEQLNAGDHSLSGLRSALDRIQSESSKWESVKKGGLDAILDLSVRKQATDCINALAKHNLLIVPVGQLESWMDLGVRKQRWPLVALDKISAGECGGNLRSFVQFAIMERSGDLIVGP